MSGPHVFSLSLPREQHLESYFGDKTPLQQYTGLQRFKKSVTGVLGNLSTKRESEPINPQNSNNWFLSKSAPNSLNNGFNSIETSSPQKLDGQENAQSLVPTNNKQNARRLMYLPELENACQNRARVRSKSAERSSAQANLSVFSKSCENISMDVKSSSEPEDLQDPPKLDNDNWRGRRPKKFTFQSTVRQIERRRLAERLSREAERKEQQRLRELEAMQKVEEEFQRKRARCVCCNHYNFSRLILFSIGKKRRYDNNCVCTQWTIPVGRVYHPIWKYRKYHGQNRTGRFPPPTPRPRFSLKPYGRNRLVKGGTTAKAVPTVPKRTSQNHQ